MEQGGHRVSRAAGRSGLCHGPVAFPAIDCQRCHGPGARHAAAQKRLDDLLMPAHLATMRDFIDAGERIAFVALSPESDGYGGDRTDFREGSISM